ncbi:MAG: hypothetical protein ABSB35_28115 [Bryobacteraceae bacterium]
MRIVFYRTAAEFLPPRALRRFAINQVHADYGRVPPLPDLRTWRCDQDLFPVLVSLPSYFTSNLVIGRDVENTGAVIVTVLLMHHSVEFTLPLVDFRDHRGVSHRDYTPDFRGGVDFPSPSAEALHCKTGIFLIGDQKQRSRRSGPQLDCLPFQNSFK